MHYGTSIKMSYTLNRLYVSKIISMISIIVILNVLLVWYTCIRRLHALQRKNETELFQYLFERFFPLFSQSAFQAINQSKLIQLRNQTIHFSTGTVFNLNIVENDNKVGHLIQWRFDRLIYVEFCPKVHFSTRTKCYVTLDHLVEDSASETQSKQLGMPWFEASERLVLPIIYPYMYIGLIGVRS